MLYLPRSGCPAWSSRGDGAWRGARSSRRMGGISLLVGTVMGSVRRMGEESLDLTVRRQSKKGERGSSASAPGPVCGGPCDAWRLPPPNGPPRRIGFSCSSSAANSSSKVREEGARRRSDTAPVSNHGDGRGLRVSRGCAGTSTGILEPPDALADGCRRAVRPKQTTGCDVVQEKERPSARQRLSHRHAQYVASNRRCCVRPDPCAAL